PQRGTGFSCR
ncbi:tex-like N-terminal domain protein, partial [Vibrio parahaemolyticus V-223/04]